MLCERCPVAVVEVSSVKDVLLLWYHNRKWAVIRDVMSHYGSDVTVIGHPQLLDTARSRHKERSLSPHSSC